MPEEKPIPIKAPPAGAKPRQVQAKADAIKKKSFWTRMKEALFVETAQNVGTYLWKDVLLPAVKKLVADSAVNAVNMAIYGDSRPRTGYLPPQQSHVANSSVYAGRAYGQSAPYYNRANRYNSILEGCLFAYKDTPLDIIHEAMDWIASYGFISVETFNQILPPALAFQTVHTDADWGWYSLNENCVVAVAGGWTIDLPPAKPRH